MLPVEITYDLTQRDFYDSLIAHRGRSSVSKWSFRLAFGLIFLLPALGLAILEINPKTTLATVVPLFVLAAFWAIFIWGVPWWSARTQFLQQPSAQGSKIMALDQSGIHWRWKSGQADQEWTNFIHFLESQTVFSTLYVTHLFQHRTEACSLLRNKQSRCVTYSKKSWEPCPRLTGKRSAHESSCSWRWS